MTDIQLLKICVSCTTALPTSKFKFRSATGRQSGQRHTMCNRCLYVKYTRPESERKIKEIHDYKVKQGCVDCGYNKNPYALEFDHIPGVKKVFNIGEKIGAYSKEKIWAEISKCEVVCANCHAIRTENRRERVTINA